MIEFCPAPVHFTGAVFVCVPEEILKKKAPKSGHVDEPRNSPTTAPLRSTTPKRASGNERAIEWGGGGPPPRLFASGLSLEKAWIPARDRAGTHVAGSTLRRFPTEPPIDDRGPRPSFPPFLGGELSSGVQHFFWRGKVETLSGSIVEHLYHFFHFLGRDLMEVGPSREELPYEAIQVLNRRFLPG